ncbi:MAG: hypothetical protein ABSG31_06155 [Tepidisphaeraceae bacterium]|jgi:hypothetical protein
MRLPSLRAAAAFAVLGLCSAGAANAATNLLLNPGAEIGTGNDSGSTVADWTVGGTSNPGRDDGTFDGFTPHGGSYDFYGGSGGVSDGSTTPAGSFSQVVNLLTAGFSASSIDSGTDSYAVEFFEQSLDQGLTLNDAGEVVISFQDASHDPLTGGYNSGEISYVAGGWKEVTGTADIPADARYMTYQMNFFLNAGTDVDAFIDDNSVSVSTASSSGPPATGVPLPSADWSALSMLGLLGLGAGVKAKNRLA